MVRMINTLQLYQSDCVDAFKMECSMKDIKINADAKKLAKYINKQGKIIDKIIKLLMKIK